MQAARTASVLKPNWNLLRSQELPRIEQGERGHDSCVTQNAAPLSGFHSGVKYLFGEQRRVFVAILSAVLLMCFWRAEKSMDTWKL